MTLHIQYTNGDTETILNVKSISYNSKNIQIDEGIYGCLEINIKLIKEMEIEHDEI